MLSSKLNKWMRGAAVAAALAITTTVGASASMAPSFSLPSRSGDTVSLAQLKGKVVMKLAMAFIDRWRRDEDAECRTLD